jgi:predicted dehydrogenase
MLSRPSRRHLFFGSLLGGPVPVGGFGSVPSLRALGYKSPNEKLHVAAIGGGGRPAAVLRTAAEGGEVITAVADCDWRQGQESFERFPKAARYKDFREMLDKSAKDIDAVIVGTPDHMHTICSLACMQAGKHVYCEKPLTRTAWEARFLTQAAGKYKVATQMGNQGYSHEATRVACEIVWSGEIGEVTEVHAWHGRPGWPQGMQSVPPPTPVPETLDWDLWLGGAAWRPYTEGSPEYREFVARRNGGNEPRPSRFGFYLPFNWRGFYDFGTTLIGDWGVHILGPANWALQLSPESLRSVECVQKDSLPPFTYPDELTIRYEFGPRGSMPPVTVYWYQKAGSDPYTPPGMTIEEARRIPDTGPEIVPVQAPRNAPARAQAADAPKRSGYNSILVGSKGYLGTSGRGEGVGLLPGKRWAEYKLPPASLSRAPGASRGSNAVAHVRDWVRSCKGGSPACSDFRIGGPYTEWLVLGAAALHVDGKLQWDPARGEFTNSKQANRWLRPEYRKGWEVRA